MLNKPLADDYIEIIETLAVDTLEAFSLVELSIVLVILGLLIGGILSGRSLIRAAELRSATEQQASLFTAINSFRDKYFTLPGDMPNAQQFWGAASACPNGPQTGTQTCNGDGDGKIVETMGFVLGHYQGIGGETSFFWQHLSNAQLISGQLNEPTTTAGMFYLGKMPSSAWQFSTYDYSVEGSINQLILGNMDSSTSNILRPEELWNIDTKMDDGKPNSGAVLSNSDDPAQCTTSSDNTDTTAQYLVSNSDIACGAVFVYH